MVSQNKRQRNGHQYTTLDELINRLNAEYRRDSEYHADCPFCGKPVKRGDTHFSFGVKGWYCQIEQRGGSLRSLAQHLELPLDHRSYAPLPKRNHDIPQLPLAERVDLASLVDQYHSHPNAYATWLTYMPYLSRETFDEYRLGEGRLPARQKGEWQKTHRLILPLVVDREIVGLRGRLIPNARLSEAPKWIFAAGSQTPFFNADRIVTNDTKTNLIVICENNTDSIGIQQQHPTISGLKLASTSPTTGVRTRLPQTLINACTDKIVILWTDNDPAGRDGAATWQHQLENSAKLVVTFAWSPDDPAKADLGDLLTADFEQGTNRVGNFLAYVARSQVVDPNGLSNQIRFAALRTKKYSENILDDHTALGLMLDVLIEGINAGHINLETINNGFTIRDIQSIGEKLGRGQIAYSTLRHAFDLFFAIFSTPKNPAKNRGGKNDKNSANALNGGETVTKLGRTAHCIYLPPPELIQERILARAEVALVIGEYVRSLYKRIDKSKTLTDDEKKNQRAALRTQLKTILTSEGIEGLLAHCRLEYHGQKSLSSIQTFEAHAHQKLSDYDGRLLLPTYLPIAPSHNGNALTFENASHYRRALNLTLLKQMPGGVLITTNAEKGNLLGVSSRTAANYRKFIDPNGNRQTLIYAIPHCDQRLLPNGKSASTCIQTALTKTIQHRGGPYGIYISWSKGDSLQFREVTAFRETDTGEVDWSGIDRTAAIWQQRGYTVSFHKRIGTRESLSAPDRLMSIETTFATQVAVSSSSNRPSPSGNFARHSHPLRLQTW